MNDLYISDPAVQLFCDAAHVRLCHIRNLPWEFEFCTSFPIDCSSNRMSALLMLLFPGPLRVPALGLNEVRRSRMGAAAGTMAGPLREVPKKGLGGGGAGRKGFWGRNDGDSGSGQR